VCPIYYLMFMVWIMYWAGYWEPLINVIQPNNSNNNTAQHSWYIL
jgi:hypothetical protein